jgi:putative endonuclease
MAEHNQVGIEGEQLACQFLEARGYTILHRNWRHGRDELDIVAEHPNALVFLEVKTRRTDRHGTPDEAVNLRKQQRTLRAADAYLDAHPVDRDVRYDIIAVVLDPSGPRIDHLIDAFHPTP